MKKNPITKSDVLSILCGAICLVRGIWYIHDFFSWSDRHLSMDYWYGIPQIVLCFVGIFLTVWRFFRKGKGLTYKEYEWIPLIISFVYSFVMSVWALVTPWDLSI